MQIKFVKQELLLNFDGLPVQDNFQPIPWVSKTVTCNVLERLAFCDYSTRGQFRMFAKSEGVTNIPREGEQNLHLSRLHHHRRAGVVFRAITYLVNIETMLL